MMVGTDIVSVKRIAEAMKDKNFLVSILNDEEIEYALKKAARENEFGFSPRVMTVAGFFAAKEALLKAVGVGITHGFGFKDIVISHDSMGAPVVIFKKKLEEYAASLGSFKAYVSISHDGQYATAFASLINA